MKCRNWKFPAELRGGNSESQPGRDHIKLSVLAPDHFLRKQITVTLRRTKPTKPPAYEKILLRVASAAFLRNRFRAAYFSFAGKLYPVCVPEPPRSAKRTPFRNDSPKRSKTRNFRFIPATQSLFHFRRLPEFAGAVNSFRISGRLGGWVPADPVRYAV